MNDFISDKKDKKESVNVEGGGKKGSYQILFDQNFVFTVGRALIQPGGQVYLDKIGALIFELPNDIVVTGFANDFNKIAYPIYPSNIHLSIARANTIAQYFISVWKIDPERIGIQVEPLLQVGEEMDNVTHTTKTKVKINVVSEFHGHVRRQLKKHERERI